MTASTFTKINWPCPEHGFNDPERRHPRAGLQAEVNGQSQPVEKIMNLLRGIYLPRAVQYDITLAYRPPSIRWGGWISVLTLVGVMGGMAVFKFHMFSDLTGR